MAALTSGVLVGAVPVAPIAQAAPDGARFVAVTPQRLADTRPGQGPVDGIEGLVAAGEIVEIQVTGRMGVPASGVTAVVLNVTVTEAVGAGYVQVFPTGRATVGSSSSLNVEATGQTIANQVTVPVGDGGRVSVFLQGGGHLVADVFGYYSPAADATSGRYAPLSSPRRVLDTRDPLLVPTANPGDARNCNDFATWDAAWRWFWTYRQWGDPAGLDGDGDGIPCNSLPGPKTSSPPPDFRKLEAGSTLRIPVIDTADLPGGVASPATATAVVANLTVTDATQPGFWQVLPTGAGTLGSSSNLNVGAAGQTISNQVIAPVGSDGTITIYSQNGGHVLLDIAGVFTGDASPRSDAGLFVAVGPHRLLDTRDPALTPLTGPIPAAGSVPVAATGRFTIPAGATAVALNTTITAAAAPGYVQVFPTGAGTPGASSNLNAERAGQTLANAVYASLGTGGQFTVHTQRGGHLLADVAGWFTSASVGSAGPVPGGSTPDPEPPAVVRPPDVPPATAPAVVSPPTVGPLVVDVRADGSVRIEAPNGDRCATAVWTVSGPTSYTRSVSPPSGGCWNTAHAFDTAWDSALWGLTPGSYTVSLTLSNSAGSATSSNVFTVNAATPPVVGAITVDVMGGGRAVLTAPNADRCSTATWSVTGPTSYTRTVAPPPSGCWGTAHAFDTSWSPEWLLAPGFHTVTLTVTKPGGWTSSSTSTFVMPAHVVTVGGPGATYSTINAALVGIPDASDTNPYLVRIAAGTFVEGTVVLRQGVHLQGSGQGVTSLNASVIATTPNPWINTPRQDLRAMTINGNVSVSSRQVSLDQVSLRGGITVQGKSNGASVYVTNSDIYHPSGPGVVNGYGYAELRWSSVTASPPLGLTYISMGRTVAFDTLLSGPMEPQAGPISLSCTDTSIRPGYWSGTTFVPTGQFRPTTTRCA